MAVDTVKFYKAKAVDSVIVPSIGRTNIGEEYELDELTANYFGGTDLNGNPLYFNIDFKKPITKRVTVSEEDQSTYDARKKLQQEKQDLDTKKALAADELAAKKAAEAKAKENATAEETKKAAEAAAKKLADEAEAKKVADEAEAKKLADEAAATQKANDEAAAKAAADAAAKAKTTQGANQNNTQNAPTA